MTDAVDQDRIEEISEGPSVDEGAEQARGTASIAKYDSDEGYDDADYTPAFIKEVLENPPMLDKESKEIFLCVFESLEMGTHRPKTDHEYLLVYRAAVITTELLKYDRIRVAIVASERRVAVEKLHRYVSIEIPEDKVWTPVRKPVRERAGLFFTDADYRRKFLQQLEQAGVGSGAVEAAAYVRSLPSLTKMDHLIRMAEKRLADCLKQLNLAYAMRGPEDPMPRSLAALRADSMKEAAP